MFRGVLTKTNKVFALETPNSGYLEEGGNAAFLVGGFTTILGLFLELLFCGVMLKQDIVVYPRLFGCHFFSY